MRVGKGLRGLGYGSCALAVADLAADAIIGHDVGIWGGLAATLGIVLIVAGWAADEPPTPPVVTP